MSSILINEVHPNQESGSEWVELILVGDEEINLLNYTIFDSAKQIYKFSNEQFVDDFLVVELSGLNNDQDSVVLKDNLGNVLDYFNYTSTTKGLSWAKLTNLSQFVLTEASRGLANPAPTPTPTPTLTPTPALSSAPTSTPSAATPTPANNSHQTSTPNSTLSQITTTTTNKKIQYSYYQPNKIKLQANAPNQEERLSRLVLIGQKTATLELKNAIIGSLLLILGASCLLYVKFKKNHP